MGEGRFPPGILKTALNSMAVETGNVLSTTIQYTAFKQVEALCHDAIRTTVGMFSPM